MGHCTPADAPAMPDAHGGMTSATTPAAPMTRDGSGTSWNPDASPMEAIHGRVGGWAAMLHGAVSPRFTSQDAFDAGGRGASRLSAPNWAMGMLQRPAGTGALTLRAMVSLDRLTEGKAGYPLLFQTGESVGTRALVDEQHPHDLVSELSATLSQRVGRAGAVFGYVGYPGEPALGPTAFMHRPSAMHLPDSPLGHHWQDATHIVFGVATLGASAGPFKIDASLFTGREPDDNRVAFDRPRFDSYSARLTWAPSPSWALQASRGRIESPESLDPGLDIVRTTASALYAAATPLGTLSGALVWGYNDGHAHGGGGDHHSGHSVLAEADLMGKRWAPFVRAEVVEKSGEELQTGLDETFRIGSLTAGVARSVARFGPLRLMAGMSASAYAVPDALRPIYGRAPVSGQLFLRLTPAPMRHDGSMDHGTMDGMTHEMAP